MVANANHTDMGTCSQCSLHNHEPLQPVQITPLQVKVIAVCKLPTFLLPAVDMLERSGRG